MGEIRLIGCFNRFPGLSLIVNGLLLFLKCFIKSSDLYNFDLNYVWLVKIHIQQKRARMQEKP